MPTPPRAELRVSQGAAAGGSNAAEHPPRESSRNAPAYGTQPPAPPRDIRQGHSGQSARGRGTPSTTYGPVTGTVPSSYGSGVPVGSPPTNYTANGPRGSGRGQATAASAVLGVGDQFEQMLDGLTRGTHIQRDIAPLTTQRSKSRQSAEDNDTK